MSARFDELMNGLNEVDAFLAGETVGYKVMLPKEVDVKSIRKRLNMTQARFSDTFGFSLDAVKHWEGGRRTPESSARAFLTVIAKNPQAVIAALHSGGGTAKVTRMQRPVSVRRGPKRVMAERSTKRAIAVGR
jgi:putative transcriptional regulator